MGRVQDFWMRSKPVISMIFCQILFSAVNIMYKLSKNDGLSMKVITAYRMIFSVAALVPPAIVFEWRGEVKPQITLTVLLQSFFCGLFGGALSQNLYLESLSLTSATFATAMLNLVPAVAFMLAVPLRMEQLGIRTLAGNIKILGTVLGIGGAMVLTFYKGIHIPIPDIVVHHAAAAASPQPSHVDSGNQGLGALLAVLCCLSYAAWLILQTRMSQAFPFPYTSTALMSFMGAIQSVIYALCAEEDGTQWKLKWNVGLLTCVYGGVAISGVMNLIISWCVRVRGPLFVSVFNPLSLVLVALASALLLEENLYLGSIIGAVLIVLGLYGVLWGKGQQAKKTAEVAPPNNPTAAADV